MTAQTELSVQLLGPVRAHIGGRELALGPARPQAVFALLAMRSDRLVLRDEIIDGVWGADVPKTAVGNLHTYISSLRRLLEPDGRRGTESALLTSNRAGYRLHLDPERLDVVRFEDLRTAARRRLGGGDADGALQILDEALALWHGEALSGVPGPFADGQRCRLGELRLAAMELRAEAGLAAGAHADLVGELSVMVREHPLREAPWSQLMLALHRCGRTAEALQAYRDACETWVTELGIDPGPELRRMHERIVVDDPALRPASAPAAAPASSSPSGPVLVGRDLELDVVDELVRAVRAGRGSSLWIEGELGIGKSALVAACLDRAARAGCRTAHAVADELGQVFPLGVMLDCLAIGPDAGDPRRVAIWNALQEEPGRSVLGGGDPVFAAVNGLVALVQELCAAGPLVLALDDLQWADDASAMVWHRLSGIAHRLPLLLVGASRPVPHGRRTDRLRGDVERRGGRVVRLAPLSSSAVQSLIGDLVGAPPGPRLRCVTERAAGNPLFVREITESLVRDRVVEVAEGQADVSERSAGRAPVSLISAVSGRLGFLPDATLEVLRWATMLGADFTVDDLAVVIGRPVPALVPALQEAFGAGVLRDAGSRLAFRHPIIRQALYESMASALRVALHHLAAKALAAAGVPVERVAEQLVAAPGDIEPWVVDWLVTAAPTLIHRAPTAGADLLRRAVSSADAVDPRRAVLMARLSSVLFRIGRDTEAEDCAWRALASVTDPDDLAELRWILAYVPYRASRADEALTALRDALADPGLPLVWRARLLSLLALVQRAGIGSLDVAAGSAHAAIELGERAEDPFAVGQALEVLWQVGAVRRDYANAVRYLDRALALVGTDLSLADLRLVLLDNRMFTLQCLDRLDDASADLRLAREVAGHRAPAAGLHVAAAVHAFWLGDWDAALAELATVQDGPDFTGFGLREGGPLLLLHGVAALVAVHRDDDAALRRHLDAGATLPHITAADRENCDFLVAARAMADARAGRAGDAIATFEALLLQQEDAQMMLRHQWLPMLVRLALDAGDRATADAATRVCETEAAQETTPARAAAAAGRCRALLDGEPDGLLPVTAHYRRVGRTFELAQTLEDHAALLDGRGRRSDAAAALREATALYGRMGAAWDIRRAASRTAVRTG